MRAAVAPAGPAASGANPFHPPDRQLRPKAVPGGRGRGRARHGGALARLSAGLFALTSSQLADAQLGKEKPVVRAGITARSAPPDRGIANESLAFRPYK